MDSMDVNEKVSVFMKDVLEKYLELRGKDSLNA